MTILGGGTLTKSINSPIWAATRAVTVPASIDHVFKRWLTQSTDRFSPLDCSESSSPTESLSLFFSPLFLFPPPLISLANHTHRNHSYPRSRFRLSHSRSQIVLSRSYTSKWRMTGGLIQWWMLPVISRKRRTLRIMHWSLHSIARSRLTMTIVRLEYVRTLMSPAHYYGLHVGSPSPSSRERSSNLYLVTRLCHCPLFE